MSAAASAILDRAVAAIRVALAGQPLDRIRVAFSGGADSSALLLAARPACLELDLSLEAVHVHHGLHPHADLWQTHCEAVCDDLDVPCRSLRVEVPDGSGLGPEASARTARMTAFEDLTGEREAILTGHHRDDQAETVLMHLFRGSGIRGLAGIPERRPIGAGWLMHPLLGFTRSELRQIVAAAGLDWIEDPGNDSPELDRNFIRHRLLPLIESRRSGAGSAIARSAALLSAQCVEVEAQAERDLAELLQLDPGCLDARGLAQLPAIRQQEVLRAWFRQLQLPVPSRRPLLELLEQCHAASEDAQVRVGWQGAEVRRYRDHLYAMPNRDWQAPDPMPFTETEIRLPLDLGTLRWCDPDGGRTAPPFQDLTIAFRSGGERLKVSGAEHSRPLKHLFQEAGVPPWERDRLPLLYRQDQLQAVVGLWSTAAFEEALQRHECRLIWRRG